MNNGIFTISLDLEKFWGVAPSKTIENYGENILHVEQAIKQMLVLFEKYEVHATWAFVGFLRYKNFEDLQMDLNFELPKYKNKQQSTYTLLENIDKNMNQYLFLTGNEIDQIKATKGQELASHSFSHIYCDEAGVTIKDFVNDVKVFAKIAAALNFTPKSFVFPRNQVNDECVEVLTKNNYSSYRGKEESYGFSGNTIWHKIYRQLNLCINLSGHNTFTITAAKILNIKGSSFLHPISTKFELLNYLRLVRIKKALKYAAKKKEVYHLWWHPHNFGKNLDANIKNLELILKYYVSLKEKYGLNSMNMGEIALMIKK
jgi:peptidoglycan/xylan/chitin deacetylase (PgdA/CDA1 family)